MGTRKSNRAGIAAALALSAVALAGCEETTSVGSGCVNGNCPQALSRNDDACSVSVLTAEFAVRAPADVRPLPIVCLPTPYTRRDNGTIDARVYYFLPEDADPSIGCTDKPFLRPVSAAIREEYAEHSADAEMCELRQLAITDGDSGDPLVAAGDGFFYDDFTSLIETECTSPHGIQFTANAAAWDGLHVIVTTTEKRDAAGKIDPALSCEPIQGGAPVGTACLPTQTVFDDSHVVIETRVEACGDGLCMAYHLGGDVDPSCEEPDLQDGMIVHGPHCATPRQVEERVYCTCRCDGPPGAADLCECPDGFACIDVIPTLEPALGGRYCVRNGEVVDE
jgi:hypothetical protein